MYCQFRCFHHHRKLFIEWIGKILALNFYKLIGGFIYSSDFKIFYCNPKFCSSYQFMYARMFTHLFRSKTSWHCFHLISSYFLSLVHSCIKLTFFGDKNSNNIFYQYEVIVIMIYAVHFLISPWLMEILKAWGLDITCMLIINMEHVWKSYMYVNNGFSRKKICSCKNDNWFCKEKNKVLLGQTNSKDSNRPGSDWKTAVNKTAVWFVYNKVTPCS